MGNQLREEKYKIQNMVRKSHILLQNRASFSGMPRGVGGGGGGHSRKSGIGV